MSCLRRRFGKIDRPAQRREMAGTAVARRDVSIALACRTFGVSETCYRYSTQLSLKALWYTLGVKSLFQTDTANLSKGLPGGGYFISDVAHEAMIEVNEVGAEAAATTAAAADPFGDAPPGRPKRRLVTFNANRPFIWVLQHDTTGLILFMGRYAGS